MLSEKPWKADAVFRLFVSVLLCVFMGLLVLAAAHFVTERPKKADGLLFFAALGGALALYAVALGLLGRPWRFETFLRRFVILLVCIYGGFLLTWWVVGSRGADDHASNSTLKTVVAILSFQGAALVLIHRFVREHGSTWSEAFGFKNGWGRTLWVGALVTLLVVPAAWGLMELSGSVMEHLHLQPQEQQPVVVLQETSAWMNRAVLGVAVILVAPAAEEMLFRGILYPAVKRYGYPRLALWGTSVAFGAIHLNLAAFVPLTLLAVVLTVLYEKTGNLLAPIVTHSLFNAMNFALLYLSESLSHFPGRS